MKKEDVEHKDDDVPESGAVFSFGISLPEKFWVGGNKMVVQVACGEEHTCILSDAGKVYTFGKNSWGQLGVGDVKPSDRPVFLKNLKDEKVTHIACGRNHTLVYTENNQLFGFGCNSETQISEDLGETIFSPTEHKKWQGQPIKLLTAGGDFSAIVNAKGELFTWGSNDMGQLGIGEELESCGVPTHVPLPEPVIQVSCGHYHMGAVLQSGQLFTWGEEEGGKLGLLPPTQHPSPKQLASTGGASKLLNGDGGEMLVLTTDSGAVFKPQLVPHFPRGVIQVACGLSHTMVITRDQQRVFVWGEGRAGQLGLGTRSMEVARPTPLETHANPMMKVKAIAAAESHSALILVDGSLFTFGDIRHSKLGLEPTESMNQFVPKRVRRLQHFNCEVVCCGGCHTVVVAKRRPLSSSSGDTMKLAALTWTQLDQPEASLKATLERPLSSTMPAAFGGTEEDKRNRRSRIRMRQIRRERSTSRRREADDTLPKLSDSMRLSKDDLPSLYKDTLPNGVAEEIVQARSAKTAQSAPTSSVPTAATQNEVAPLERDQALDYLKNMMAEDDKRVPLTPVPAKENGEKPAAIDQIDGQSGRKPPPPGAPGEEDSDDYEDEDDGAGSQVSETEKMMPLSNAKSQRSAPKHQTELHEPSVGEASEPPKPVAPPADTSTTSPDPAAEQIPAKKPTGCCAGLGGKKSPGGKAAVAPAPETATKVATTEATPVSPSTPATDEAQQPKPKSWWTRLEDALHTDDEEDIPAAQDGTRKIGCFGGVSKGKPKDTTTTAPTNDPAVVTEQPGQIVPATGDTPNTDKSKENQPADTKKPASVGCWAGLCGSKNKTAPSTTPATGQSADPQTHSDTAHGPTPTTPDQTHAPSAPSENEANPENKTIVENPSPKPAASKGCCGGLSKKQPTNPPPVTDPNAPPQATSAEAPKPDDKTPSSKSTPKHEANSQHPPDANQVPSSSSEQRPEDTGQNNPPSDAAKPPSDNKDNSHIQVFHPTVDEFRDFKKYIEYIESRGAHHGGICKIVPPKEYVPRRRGYADLENFIIPEPVHQRFMGRNGVYINQLTVKRPMTMGQLKQLSTAVPHRTPDYENWAHLEKKYWANLGLVTPIYGADVSGSITDPDCPFWNIAHLPSVLDEVLGQGAGIRISGVNTPYLYFGTWMATFAWHTEDCDLYSINYIHHGAPKQWYSIPPMHARRFEAFAKAVFPSEYRDCEAFLRHKVHLIAPHLLRNAGIQVNSIVQDEGEMIITFPYGFHAGFNHGFNIAESTNFGSLRWIEYGKKATFCECRSDTVRINMEPFVRRCQPHLLARWLQDVDEVPHPLDTLYGPQEKTTTGERKKVAAIHRSRCDPITSINTPTRRTPLSSPSKVHCKAMKRKLSSCGSSEVSTSSKSAHHSSPSKVENQKEKENLATMMALVRQPVVVLSRKLGAPVTPDFLLGLSYLWSQGGAFDLQRERLLNTILSIFPPHCAICSLLHSPKLVNRMCQRLSFHLSTSSTTVDEFCQDVFPYLAASLEDNAVSPREQPSVSPVLIPDVAYTKQPTISGHHLNSTTQTMCRLLHCSVCHLSVHAVCYGVENTEDLSPHWKCERCRKRKFDANCCACPLRGGALRRIVESIPDPNGTEKELVYRQVSSKWIHVVCGLATDQIPFVCVARRLVQLPPLSPDCTRVACRLCGQYQREVPLATCGHKNCPDNTHFHVTCAHWAGYKFRMNKNSVTISCGTHSQSSNCEEVQLAILRPGESVWARDPSTGYLHSARLVRRVASVCARVVKTGSRAGPMKVPLQRILWHGSRRPILTLHPPSHTASYTLPTMGAKVIVLEEEPNATQSSFEALYAGPVPELWLVAFETGEEIELSRTEICSQDRESVPSRLRAFISSYPS